MLDSDSELKSAHRPAFKDGRFAQCIDDLKKLLFMTWGGSELVGEYEGHCPHEIAVKLIDIEYDANEHVHVGLFVDVQRGVFRNRKMSAVRIATAEEISRWTSGYER